MSEEENDEFSFFTEEEAKKYTITDTYIDEYIDRTATESKEPEHVEAEQNDPPCFSQQESHESQHESQNTQEQMNTDDEMYIISINGVPYFYEDSLQDARNTLRNIAEIICKDCNAHAESDYSVKLGRDDDEVSVVQSVDLLLFSLDHERYAIKVDMVKRFINS